MTSDWRNSACTSTATAPLAERKLMRSCERRCSSTRMARGAACCAPWAMVAAAVKLLQRALCCRESLLQRFLSFLQLSEAGTTV